MNSFCVIPSLSQPVLQNKLEDGLVFQEGDWEKARLNTKILMGQLKGKQLNLF